MSYGISTFTQRLAWQHAETRHGYDDDASLEEQLDEQDHAFKNFDTFTFAPHPRGTLGASAGGTAEIAPAPSSDKEPVEVRHKRCPQGNDACPLVVENQVSALEIDAPPCSDFGVRGGLRVAGSGISPERPAATPSSGGGPTSFERHVWTP